MSEDHHLVATAGASTAMGETPDGRWSGAEWDSVLTEIRNGNVIAVVGPELYTVEVDQQQVLLYPHLVHQVEAGLKLEPSSPPRVSFHDLACDYLQFNPQGRTEDVRNRLCERFNALAPPPPPALCALAEVRGLRLFVTTTPDDLLERAIDEVRFGGHRGTSSLVMSLNAAPNLRRPYENLREPVVFHPFGELTPKTNACVISDEDLLEFFYRLQRAGKASDLLMDALCDNQLLFIGSTFGDWVMRFFLRTAHSRQRLRLKEQRDYIVGRHLTEDPSFVRFLRLFARDTVLSMQAPLEFVTDLRNRWLAQHPVSAADEETPLPIEMPDGAVFLSYAHEDKERVLCLKRGLEAAGLTVWFDVEQLMVGEDWEHRIQEHLVRCDFVLPCISRSTESPATHFNRYFREEWRQAARIYRRSAQTYEYLIPVLLDRIEGGPKAVPEEFTLEHMALVLDGKVTPEFRERMCNLAAERRRWRHDT